MATVLGERVKVHLNLQRGDFSITSLATGRVELSAADVTLQDVTFRVSETTRLKILRTKRRRVHAWAIGTLTAVDTNPSVTGRRQVSYNPYRAPTFTDGGGTPVEAAPEVVFAGKFGWLKP